MALTKFNTQKPYTIKKIKLQSSFYLTNIYLKKSYGSKPSKHITDKRIIQIKLVFKKTSL